MTQTAAKMPNFIYNCTKRLSLLWNDWQYHQCYNMQNHWRSQCGAKSTYYFLRLSQRIHFSKPCKFEESLRMMFDAIVSTTSPSEAITIPRCTKMRYSLGGNIPRLHEASSVFPQVSKQVIVNLYSAFMWSHPKRAHYEISTEKREDLRWRMKVVRVRLRFLRW